MRGENVEGKILKKEDSRRERYLMGKTLIGGNWVGKVLRRKSIEKERDLRFEWREHEKGKKLREKILRDKNIERKEY